MTTTQLKSRLVKILPVGYGHFEIVFYRRGKKISRITTDTQAIDRINSDESERKVIHGYTYKEALQSLLTIN